MITSNAAGKDGVERMRGWLRNHGVIVYRAGYYSPFDLYTQAGARIEVKCGPLAERVHPYRPLEKIYGWFFNLHRHGVLNEENVDFYAFRCEPNSKLRELGFNAPIHIIRPAPLGKLTVPISVRSLFDKWAVYVNALDALKRFDASVSEEHRLRTLELAERLPRRNGGRKAKA